MPRLRSPDWLAREFALYLDMPVPDAVLQALGPEFQLFEPPQSEPPRRRRKPSLRGALKEARAAGVDVKAAVVTSDGVELRFGQPETTDAGNPWVLEAERILKQ